MCHVVGARWATSELEDESVCVEFQPPRSKVVGVGDVASKDTQGEGGLALARDQDDDCLGRGDSKLPCGDWLSGGVGFVAVPALDVHDGRGRLCGLPDRRGVVISGLEGP